MKRIFLSLIVAMICTMGMYAQTSLVATLQHGSSIQAFYGEDALVNAYEVASEGDVITLSGGNFNTVNTFKKAITIKGSGMNSSQTTQQTNINSGFTVNAPSESGKIFSMEGIYCENVISITSNAQFVKCMFLNEVGCGGNNHTATFIQCIFYSNSSSSSQTAAFRTYGSTKNWNVLLQNCYIRECAYQGTNHNFTLENCVINSLGNSLTGFLKNSTLKNCIIWGGTYKSATNNVFFNCLLCNVSENNIPDPDTDLSTCTTLIDAQNNTIFTNGSNGPRSCYGKLTDYAAVTYLGSDGTQVGMYGGEHPFSMTPSYPFVKRLDVSTSRNNGKVNLRINVE